MSILDLFNKYENRYLELRDLMQDDMPRVLRLFNIRLRLSIDINITFKGDIALTKSREVRDTYQLIFQLLESWNAYEGLSKYADSFHNFVSKGKTKSQIYSQEHLKPVGSMIVFKSTLHKLESLCSTRSGFKDDFIQYLDRLIHDEQIGKALTKDAEKIRSHITESYEISGIELLSLIYAERNLYYHNSEAAKMGMRYSNRKLLLSEYLNSLRAHTLLLASYLLTLDINRNR